MISAKDRVPLYPGRTKMMPVSGQPNVYDLTRADQPQQVGTPLDRRTMQLLQADIRTYPVKAGNNIQAGDVVDVIDGKVNNGFLPVGDLPVGSVIQLKEYSALVDYIIVHQGLPSAIYDASCDGTWVLRKDIVGLGRWGSDDSATSDYSESYLNGELASRLNAFDTATKGEIKQVKIPYRPGASGETISSGANGFSCKCFALSGPEVGLYYPLVSDGAPLAYFQNGGNAKRIAIYNGNATAWWLRSPDKIQNAKVGLVGAGGDNQSYPCNTYYDPTLGYRPALVLNKTYITKVAPPTQAIALQSGTGGQSIDVIFDGTAELPGITAGTSITSPGVQGYAPQDGWLWVRPEWEQQMGVLVVSGSYLGTGTYGTNAPNALTFDFTPKIVFVLPTKSTAGNVVRGGRLMLLYGSTVALNDDCNHPVPSTSRDFYGYTLIVSWDENSVKWFSSESAIGQNNEGTTTYYYVAIG